MPRKAKTAHLWKGGGRLIRNRPKVGPPPALGPIVSRYGTGPGRIVLDLDAAFATTPGGVVTIPNRGGAGASYVATAEGTGLTLADGAVNITTTGYLALASVLDINGLCLFLVHTRTGVAQVWLAGGTDGAVVTSLRFNHGTTASDGTLMANLSINQTPGTSITLIGFPRNIGIRSITEIELSAARGRVAQNDVVVTSGGRAGPHPIRYIGKADAAQTPVYEGQFYRLIAMRRAADNAATDAAIAEVHAALKAQYGTP